MDEKQLEHLELNCPRCRLPGDGKIVRHCLRLDQVFSREQGFVIEGLFLCSNPQCRAVYPILAGVPVILKDLKGWWNAQHHRSSSAPGRSPEIREFFRSLHVSEPDRVAEKTLLGSYMDSHYNDMVRVETPPALSGIGSLLQKTAEAAAPPPPGKVGYAIDLGCSVGRFTFELARFSDLSVGMDLNFAQVAAAAGIQRSRSLCYHRKRGGNVFDPIQAPCPVPQNVLFLVGDALDPPFEADRFDLVASLNLLDSVKLPLVLIGQMDALLKTGGTMLLGSPYTWRADISDPEEWLESEDMDAPQTVRRILEGSLFTQMDLRYQVIRDLPEVPWIMRHEQRHWSLFLVHLLQARKV